MEFAAGIPLSRPAVPAARSDETQALVGSFEFTQFLIRSGVHPDGLCSGTMPEGVALLDSDLAGEFGEPAMLAVGPTRGGYAALGHDFLRVSFTIPRFMGPDFLPVSIPRLATGEPEPTSTLHRMRGTRISRSTRLRFSRPSTPPSDSWTISGPSPKSIPAGEPETRPIPTRPVSANSRIFARNENLL